MNSIFGLLAPVLGPILRFICNFVGNYGIAIILFSVLIKVLILPLTIKQQRSMVETRRIQPYLNELQRKYKNDKDKYAIEMQKLYKQHNINPMGGCLPLLVQMPIIFGLYYVIIRPVTYIMGVTDTGILQQIVDRLQLGIEPNMIQTSEIQIAEAIGKHYDQVADLVPNVSQIDFSFLGLNLAEKAQFSQPSLLWIIPILAGLTTWLQTKFMTASMGNNQPSGNEQADQAQSMTKSMNMIMPFFTAYFGFILPAGLGLYWIVNNVIAILQQFLLSKFYFKELPPIEIEKNTKNKKKCS